jgi:hypothetical protein
LSSSRIVRAFWSNTAAEAELRLEEIKRVVEAPQEAGVGVWRELIFWPSAMVRRILVCAVGLNFLQHAAGIDPILLYSPLVFKKAGMSLSHAILGTVRNKPHGGRGDQCARWSCRAPWRVCVRLLVHA